MFGNLMNDYLFSTYSYFIDKADGSGKKFTTPVVNEEKLKLFEDFCKKEGIKRQDSANYIGTKEYHIFEGFHIICGSKDTYKKLFNHFTKNIPLKKGTIKYNN